jgi:hypothetical protein
MINNESNDLRWRSFLTFVHIHSMIRLFTVKKFEISWQLYTNSFRTLDTSFQTINISDFKQIKTTWHVHIIVVSLFTSICRSLTIRVCILRISVFTCKCECSLLTKKTLNTFHLTINISAFKHQKNRMIRIHIYCVKILNFH